MAPSRERVPHAHATGRRPAGRHRAGSQRREPARKAFRPDVEGLRGIAVVAVLLYHASLPFVTGGYVGVDIFFVISGFLITGLLLREIEGTGTISIRGFYARRAKRLLPSFTVVLVAVAALSWALFSPVRRLIVAGDVIASGVYVINWRLVSRAIDYLAAGTQESPVQHFWSLAVEEQFYLAWPALLLLVTWWWRRSGRNIRPVLAGALATVAAASFGWCVYLTYAEAGRAYFSTLTRGWELALGGVLALVLASPRTLPRWLAALLSACGFAAIGWSAVAFGDDTSFPGALALVPTLGAGALIVAGSTTTTAWPHRLLSLPPLRHVGRVSYVWYMWHWPFIVFAQAHWGHLSALQAVLVVAASYVPALLTHRLVEEPFRRFRGFSRVPARALRFGMASTCFVVLLGAGLHAATPTMPTASKEDAKGARALEQTKPPQPRAAAVRPAPQEAADDRGPIQNSGCLAGTKDTSAKKCVYGDKSSKHTVVLFGDSHAMQWSTALNKVAKDRHWRLVVFAKAGCPPADIARYKADLRRAYTECGDWRKDALQQIDGIAPDMVLTSSLTDYTVMEGDRKLPSDASDNAFEAGYARTLERLRSTGARVFVVHEVPHPPQEMPDCVSQHLKDLRTCAFSKKTGFDFAPVGAEAAKKTDGVKVIDPTPKLCQNGECPAVIGNVLVYRNAGHLTATYVRTLDHWLGKQLPRHLD
ncbi:MAG: acyltransferase family protein [Streptosporangiales bacterium]